MNMNTQDWCSANAQLIERGCRVGLTCWLKQNLNERHGREAQSRIHNIMLGTEKQVNKKNLNSRRRRAWPTWTKSVGVEEKENDRIRRRASGVSWAGTADESEESRENRVARVK